MKRKIFLMLLFLMIILVYKQGEEVVLIPDASIRLRVIPNSNDPEDVYIKEEVKKYLESNVFDLTKGVSSIDDARMIIQENISQVENSVNDIFANNDYVKDFRVNYGSNYFPEKKYDGVVYKEGYYESLVISIGDAKGDNFWCVLFPNLCLVDEKERHTYKSFLGELINKIF